MGERFFLDKKGEENLVRLPDVPFPVRADLEGKEIVYFGKVEKIGKNYAVKSTKDDQIYIGATENRSSRSAVEYFRFLEGENINFYVTEARTRNKEKPCIWVIKKETLPLKKRKRSRSRSRSPQAREKFYRPEESYPDKNFIPLAPLPPLLPSVSPSLEEMFLNFLRQKDYENQTRRFLRY